MSVLSIIYQNNNVVINDDPLGKQNIIAKTGKRIRQQLQTGFLSGILLDATISESHKYDSEITQNPIEDGSNVADHIQLKPVKLSLEGLITDTPLGLPIISNIQNIYSSVGQLSGKKESRSIEAMNALIDLRNKKIPFTITTNLKRYENMVFTSLEFPLDADTGKALKVVAELEQIKIVQSKFLDGVPSDELAPRVKSKKDFGQKITDPTKAGSKVDQELNNNESFLFKIARSGKQALKGF